MSKDPFELENMADNNSSSDCSSESSDNSDMELASTCESPDVLEHLRGPLSPTIRLGNVTIEESSHVHFGNKVRFNGPVVIKEYIEQTVDKASNSTCFTAQKPPAREGPSPSPVTFEERFLRKPQWFAVPARGELVPLERSPVDYVVIAHTGGPYFPGRTASTNTMRSIQYNCFVKGMADVCYNFVVGGDGHIYEGSGWEYQGVFSDSLQSESVCIGFMGDFMLELPPKSMIDAAFCLLEEGVRTGKLSSDYKLFAHKQVHDTDSPGSAFIQVVKKWPHFSNYEQNL